MKTKFLILILNIFLFQCLCFAGGADLKIDEADTATTSFEIQDEESITVDESQDGSECPGSFSNYSFAYDLHQIDELIEDLEIPVEVLSLISEGAAKDDLKKIVKSQLKNSRVVVKKMKGGIDISILGGDSKQPLIRFQGVKSPDGSYVGNIDLGNNFIMRGKVKFGGKNMEISHQFFEFIPLVNQDIIHTSREKQREREKARPNDKKRKDKKEKKSVAEFPEFFLALGQNHSLITTQTGNFQTLAVEAGLGIKADLRNRKARLFFVTSVGAKINPSDSAILDREMAPTGQLLIGISY